MIEKTVLDYLCERLDIPVYTETPENPPAEYIVLVKTGGGIEDYICSATFAIKSISSISLLRAAEINEQVKSAMDDIITLDTIYRSKLNGDYNYTDTQTKQYRYQAVYDLKY